MKRFLLHIFTFIISSTAFGQKDSSFIRSNIDSAKIYYDELTCEYEKPSFDLFLNGLSGYNQLCAEGKVLNKKILSLIDFTISSKERRLWVIDLSTMTVTNNSLVAHGRNTGNEYAQKFSNTQESYMSSLGFYVTGKTYFGKHGYSLYLDGMEPGINDNARERAIVIHAADYATWSFIKTYGRLGRSYGCPALPPVKAKKIINKIKGGSCLFIYYPDPTYLQKSKYLK